LCVFEHLLPLQSPTVADVDATPRTQLSMTFGLGALLLGLPR
jgi:hypothetical protein